MTQVAALSVILNMYFVLFVCSCSLLRNFVEIFVFTTDEQLHTTGEQYHTAGEEYLTVAYQGCTRSIDTCYWIAFR